MQSERPLFKPMTSSSHPVPLQLRVWLHRLCCLPQGSGGQRLDPTGHLLFSQLNTQPVDLQCGQSALYQLSLPQFTTSHTADINASFKNIPDELRN